MESKQSRFDKVDNAVYKILRAIAYCGTVFLAGIMLLAFVNVVLEKLHKIGVPVTGIADTANMIKFMNVAVVYLATGFVTLERGHTSVDLLTRRYHRYVQTAIEAISHLAGAIIIAYVTYLGYLRVLTNQIENNARINDTLASSWAQWPFGLIYVVGMGLLSFSFLWGFIRICFRRPAASAAVDPEAENEKLLAQVRSEEECEAKAKGGEEA